MAEVRDNLRYAKSHEWVKVDGDIATVGITDHAQESLTDIVFVELPKVGDTFELEDEFGVIESVKSASDLYMPVSGEIVDVNAELENAPELVNESPYDNGWMIKVKMDDPEEVEKLLKPNAYLSMSES